MADEAPKPASDFLDQSEIDRLLAQTTEQSAGKPLVIPAAGRRAGSAAAEYKIEAYDFRNPAFLSEYELRRLRVLHEDFIRYLSARLALFLRMEFGLKLGQLSAVSYVKFTGSLASPTHVCLFKAEPLLGVGVLEINPRLALTIVDRLLGGRGHSVKAERQLTEIEIALLEDIIVIILEEWCGQWKHEQELHPLIIGHENDGRFLQTSPREAIMLTLTLEASFGDCAEQIQIGVPYYTIEPIVKKM
jgi:flagellar motor switch protein FliM